MGKKSQIPVHSLGERGKSNFEINKIEKGMVDLSSYPSEVEHRDDYYIFIYQEYGSSNITIDFQDVTLSDHSIFCIQPGQVHFGNFAPDTSAWIVSAAAEWVPAEFRVFLTNSTISRQPLRITTAHNILIFQKALDLLHLFENENGPLSKQAVKSMFDVCLQLFIQMLQEASANNFQSNSRPAMITQQFKSLLLSNFRIMKSPAEYATVLNITPAYLNEVVKDKTGYPVTHWIHQEIMLEAKRTLFYTNNTSKEIAHALGYSDPAYFIRLFKKITGISPLQFRQKYRK